MNLESWIPTTLDLQLAYSAIAIALIGVLLSLHCVRRQRKHRALLELAEKQIEDLRNILARNKETFDANAERMAEQARHVAWLDNRIRQPKLASDEVLDEAALNDAPKLNITERRHRVIKLAARGQNVDSIASALGMLPGEVELIINLNQAVQRK